MTVYRIIEAVVPDGQALETDLTKGELLGLSILAAQTGEPDDFNVYYRAWRKMHPLIQRILNVVE